jgi:hypothetical protein
MSVESLLAVILLIALTLGDWLVRVLRARTRRQLEEPAASAPHREPAGVPHPALTPPPVPERHPRTERLGAGQPVPTRQRPLRATPAVPRHGDSLLSRRGHVSLLRHPDDLRRAMTLIAVLGPCKGLEGDTVADGR